MSKKQHGPWYLIDPETHRILDEAHGSMDAAYRLHAEMAVRGIEASVWSAAMMERFHAPQVSAWIALQEEARS